jgi:hypothetical protein
MPTVNCPSCSRTLTYPDHVAGKDTFCPLCGARFSVSPSGHIVGQRRPPKPARPVAEAADLGPYRVVCPTCNLEMSVGAGLAGKKGRCPNCNQKLKVAPPPKPLPTDETILVPIIGASPQVDAPAFLTPTAIVAKAPVRASAPPDVSDPCTDLAIPDARGKRPMTDKPQDDSVREHLPPHSGLGIASFLIAMLVGGMDMMLAAVIALNIATASRQHDVELQFVGGGMSLMCLNCASVPLCLVGAGLGIVGLVAQRGRNHLFTWMALLGNSVVILGVLGIYFLGAVVGAAKR